jgi:predicted ATPase/transcriptional regulator with XRE-family HTH domain
MSNAPLDSFTTFGELLRYLRRRMQMTQQELGTALGYSTAMVARLESGERLPDPALVKTAYVEALGLEHEPELAARLVELAAAARGHAPSASPAVAERKPFGAPNLPTPLTSFFGRERDIATAVQLLRRADVRLVTLLGPPGVGKTRLAIEVARQASEDFADGVCFVPLAPLSDPAQVPAAVAQALGVGAAQADPLVGVKLHLRDKHLLLALDNFEHLLEAAPLVAEVLAAAPRVKVLTTSRVELRLSAEHVCEVPPLDEPAAVELFAARAAAVRPGFALTPESRGTVAALCRRLDRLPLALELAAARLRLFSPRALLARLASDVPTRPALDVLAEGPRDLPARQRTLRATVEWSYNLLTPGQQRLLRHLSVFAGGCGLVAARAVAGAPPAFNADLPALLDSSLVQHADGPDGEPRLNLLEMIREYAAEQLAACGEADAAHSRHAAYFADLASTPSRLWQADSPLPPGGSTGTATEGQMTWWMDSLATERDNLRAALAWCLGDGRGAAGTPPHDGEAGIQLAGWLFGYWYMRGPWSEATHWLERALGVLATPEPSLTRARLLIAHARFAGAAGDPARAVAEAQEATAIYRATGEQRELDVTFARWVLEDAQLERNNLSEAQRIGEEWLAAGRDLNDPDVIAGAAGYLGDIALCRGDLPRARDWLDESLRFAPGWPNILNFQGTLACCEGDYDRARALCEEALAGMRAERWTHGIATVLHSLGDIALFSGDVGQAQDRFAEGLRMFGENGNKQRAVWCLGGLAALEATAGDAARAVTLWAAVEAIHAAIGSPRPALRVEDYRQRVEAARTKIDERAWANAAATGRAMNFEQAVTYALEGE